MKKFSLVFLIALIAACQQPTSPLPVTTTAPVQIVFRSPRDMNLQPADVPDLQEVPVENPATAPLLPEAIDQDQRTYVNIDQDINIESNVIMVPEQTTRTNDELYNLVVVPRWPGLQRQGKDESCNLGYRCRLIPVTHSRCGTGWVAIIARYNVINYLIGCGRGIDKDRLIRLGRLIDDRVKAPPKPEEIALATRAMQEATQTQAANAAGTALAITLTPPTPVGPTPTESKCPGLNLTPEECANSGSHDYSIVSIECPTGACQFGSSRIGDTWSVKFTFSSNSVSIFHSFGGYDTTYQRTGNNTYSSRCPCKGCIVPTVECTVVFSVDGFIQSFSPHEPASWVYSFKIIK